MWKCCVWWCIGRLVLTHGVGFSVFVRIQQGCVRDTATPPFTWPAAHDAPDQQSRRLEIKWKYRQKYINKCKIRCGKISNQFPRLYKKKNTYIVCFSEELEEGCWNCFFIVTNIFQPHFQYHKHRSVNYGMSGLKIERVQRWRSTIICKYTNAPKNKKCDWTVFLHASPTYTRLSVEYFITAH